MGTTITTALALQTALFNEAEKLAQQLNVSQNELFEMALAQFISSYESSTVPDDKTDAGRVINQGDIYWVQVENPGISHPHVVIQDNVFNHSRIDTVVVCALTSNLKKINMPGNVLLDVGEASLTRQSIVEVSKIATVAKNQLGDYIGSLTEQRIQQIFSGMRFVQMSFFDRHSTH